MILGVYYYLWKDRIAPFKKEKRKESRLNEHILGLLLPCAVLCCQVMSLIKRLVCVQSTIHTTGNVDGGKERTGEEVDEWWVAQRLLFFFYYVGAIQRWKKCTLKYYLNQEISFNQFSMIKNQIKHVSLSGDKTETWTYRSTFKYSRIHRSIDLYF